VTDSQVVLSSVDFDVSFLWRQRFGNFDSQCLLLLSRLKMDIALPSIQEEEGVFAACLAREQHKDVFDT
jgi:hypothetical protein